MTQRKVWTNQQDEALKEILNKGIKKWNSVAEVMEKDYKIYGRTGKQCRERWHNQLDPKINNDAWTTQQQKVLFRLHNQMGNSWAKISHQFKGRTDNAVKNHFYSTLRKAFRRLNRHVGETKSQKNRQLKTIVLTKLLAAAEDRFDKKLNLAEEVSAKSNQLKNRLIDLSRKIDQQKEQAQQMNKLIDQLHDFTKSWKRKKKKGRKTTEDYDDDQSVGDAQQEKESSPPPPPPIKRPTISKKQSAVLPVQTFIRRQSSRLSMKHEQSQMNQPSQSLMPLNSRRSSKRHSVSDMFLEPQYMYRLKSNPSYIIDDDQMLMFRKRSSNKSFSSFLGSSLFPRLSDTDPPRAGYSLNDSNHFGTGNLFELAEFPLEKLD